jgi:hypothetical protein
MKVVTTINSKTIELKMNDRINEVKVPSYRLIKLNDYDDQEEQRATQYRLEFNKNTELF